VLRAFCTAALVLAAPVAVASPPDMWSGTYVFTESAGRTAGGTPIVIGHTMTITRSATGYHAEIVAIGYQTSVEIVAVAPITATLLVLSFERGGENHKFKGRYKPGEVLLVLEQRDARTLITHWRAYTPWARSRFRNSGIYFRRR
jgi:hypothetical protein